MDGWIKGWMDAWMGGCVGGFHDLLPDRGGGERGD